MCGIVGIIGREPAGAAAAVEAIAHRGPDGRGEFSNAHAWFGHRRLAIVDLTSSGAQPMSKAGCGTIAFNGEIYDHEHHREALRARGVAFESSSDTEVLLRGLTDAGQDFLANVHGMYAFAWLLPDASEVWLARDHAGMKPLYVWRGSDAVVFGSEIRAVARMMQAVGTRPRIRRDGLAEVLAWGAVQEPGTILEGVEMVPPDAVLAISTREPSRVRTVSVRRIVSSDRRAPAEGVREVVHRAVKRHLVADTGVALFLSGGIDSGVLAIESARDRRDVTAIHVTLGTSDTADEPMLVRALADRLRIPLEVVPVGEWHGIVRAALAAYDQPSVDGLNTYVVARAAHQLGFKAALSGVGADEVFGGYRHLRLRNRTLIESATLGRAAGLLLRPFAERSRALRRIEMVFEAAAAGGSTQAAWRRLLPVRVVDELLPDAKPAGARSAGDCLQIEQATYLRNTLLRDTDVMGMAHGVEVRAPFLDPEVLSYARSVGTAALVDATKPAKWILRETWARELGEQASSRRKTGFSLDVGGWLLGPGADTLREAVDLLQSERILEAEALARLWRRVDGRLRARESHAWVVPFALVQLAEQVKRWGRPS